MVTIREVASAANVSIATVSRVLNKNRPVHPAIQRAVEDAAKRLNYHPNAAARGLRKASSRTLGIISPDLSNEPYARQIIGIEGTVSDQGFGLFVCDARNNADRFLKHLNLLQEHRVEGLLLTPAPSRRISRLLAQIEQQGTHVVMFGRRRAFGDHPEVYLEEFEPSVEAYRMLLDLGHRRVALLMVSDVTDQRLLMTTSAEIRLAAYQRAYEEAGVPCDERLIVKARNGEEMRNRLATLLKERNRPTAVIAGWHNVVPDVLLAIQQSGLRIPTDLSLIVHGDSRWVEAHDPPISAIGTDDIAFGRRGGELLLSLIAGDETPLSVGFPSTFVQRASCAPPP